MLRAFARSGPARVSYLTSSCPVVLPLPAPIENRVDHQHYGQRGLGAECLDAGRARHEPLLAVALLLRRHRERQYPCVFPSGAQGRRQVRLRGGRRYGPLPPVLHSYPKFARDHVDSQGPYRLLLRGGCQGAYRHWLQQFPGLNTRDHSRNGQRRHLEVRTRGPTFLRAGSWPWGVRPVLHCCVISACLQQPDVLTAKHLRVHPRSPSALASVLDEADKLGRALPPGLAWGDSSQRRRLV
ncbi:hypothetical protein T492DRAFT_1004697 [Pavlovales sp. CCMP2436]|nr:hypothetical protein T492DRAFT_1004697 [Pavlovales sp. CCMP2436]|mmetsp:Transcript_5476/g.14298  ORF Transcript_5476/g.14298 Transcript_5476/m.14298 type:complete len:240 (-) Transcript_5476:164-883(-)